MKGWCVSKKALESAKGLRTWESQKELKLFTCFRLIEKLSVGLAMGSSSGSCTETCDVSAKRPTRRSCTERVLIRF